MIGLIAGFASVRDALVSELADVAGAVQDLNQCYSFFGVAGHAASTCGSDYEDALDFCDSVDDAAGAADNCITFEGTSDEGGGEEGGADGDGGAIGGGVLVGGGGVIVRPPLVLP